MSPNQISAVTDVAVLKFGLVVSRFNSFVTDRLLAGALDVLRRAGVAEKNINVVRVPGAFEIPIAVKKLAATHHYAAVIAIGCVLRGETTHYEYISSEVARGVQLAQLDTGVPIVFCVLTCDTLEQAIDRAGLKGGNKGSEAGHTALEMAALMRKLNAGSSGSTSSSSKNSSRLPRNRAAQTSQRATHRRSARRRA